MFNDVNEVRLMGNITNDPDLRFTPGGTPVLTFGMATNYRYKKGDEWTDEPTFHNIVVWGQQAQSLSTRIRKGTRVYLGGRVQTRSWDGADGKKQYKTEIVADKVELISRYNDAPGGGGETPTSAPVRAAADGSASKPAAPVADIDPDDLPF